MSHIIAGRPGALPFGYVPRETETITANTPAAAVDREARAQTISAAAQRVEEKKAATPQEPAPPRVRAVAVIPPKPPEPPEPPPRVIRETDVIAALPESEKGALTRGDLAEVMGLRGVEIDRLDNTLTRLRKKGAVNCVKRPRGSFGYYRRTSDEARDAIPARWQALLDVLPIEPEHGIALNEVIEKFNAHTGEQASRLSVKGMINKMIPRGLMGPAKKVGTGYLRLFYRITGGQEMNAEAAAVAIDHTIATLSHDPDIGQKRHIQHSAPIHPHDVRDDDDSDIVDATAVLAADTQARDLREESIDEAMDERPLPKEWANVAMNDMIEDMRQRKVRLERDMQMVKDISSATLGLTTMEAVDLLEWLSKRLIESHEQRHAEMKGRAG